MNIKKLFNPLFYFPSFKKYKLSFKKDKYALSTFHGNGGEVKKWEKKSLEYKCVKNYRLLQSNMSNIWKYYYRFKCKRLARMTGVEFYVNLNIGDALVIGHWGRIIVSGDAKIGKQCMLTHGVTIGRDIRGKRKGVPIIGDRVCIRANSTVVGNVIIGNDVLIAPNTFVNFDVPSNSIVIGNPAKIISRENASEGHIGLLKNE